MIIRFMKRAGIYNAGEVAGFLSPHEKRIALDYVERGVAVECDKDGNLIEPRPAEGQENADVGGDGEGEKASDLGSLSKKDLVALAEKREVTVTRAEGEGEPLKSDYVRALTEASEGAGGDEGDGDNEGEGDQSDEPSS